MNIQSCNGTTSTRVISVIVLGLLIAAMAAPSAMACHRVDKNGDPKPHGKEQDCGPSAPFPGAQNDTIGHFFDEHPHVWSDDFTFHPQGLTLESGDYVWDGLGAPEIVIDTAHLSLLHLKGRKSDVCSSFENNGIPLTPDSLSYGWVDDCTVGGCAVEIYAGFSGGVFELTEGESDQVDFVMEAVVSASDTPPNPFSVEQILTLNRLQAEFKKPGTTRTFASCQWTVSGYDLPLFHSSPVP